MNDVALAAAGDRDAFGRLITAYAGTVTSIALAIVRDFSASQDVAQDVFLVAWRDVRKLRNPDSFLPWVRQVTRNRAYSWLREQRPSVRDADAVLAAVVDSRMTAPERLERDEQQRLVADVIDSLPDDAREVITLYYSEGRSARQVADLLGISEVAVKKRLSRARERIREDLLERFGETVRRAAPGAAFTATVLASLTFVAPAASAATAGVAAKVAGGSKVLAIFLSALPGMILGNLGVFYGLRKHLKLAKSETERQELRRYGKQTMTAVTLAALGFGVAGVFDSVVVLVLNQLWFLVALTWLCMVRLPRITGRPLEMKNWAGWVVGVTLSTATVVYAAMTLV
ncbi:MAG TPA: sigma-70 family RNA polymerase sigma factor [Thermoanaerobaculia bacterium]|jgi:RNA polymerase sigma factor (sigma-70 family)